MFEAKVTFNSKKGISRSGVSTLKAIHLLSFKKVRQVKTIRTFDLMIDGTDKNQVKDVGGSASGCWPTR
jgi:phosphoribosylformylglycinamidine (FGAM) synthase PurS component